MSNNHGDIVIEAPAGYKWDEGTLKKITYVAEAGGVKYDALQKAIDAAKSKAVVTMLADTRENVTISTPYNGLMLHASAAALGGRAYLFSGPCGRGKSTHTRLWQQTFGEAVQVFNDDKPALRRLDGRWYAYGTPWCGKDGINLNQKWPLGGICFLEKSQENRIRRPPELRNHAPRGGGGRTMKLKENFVLRQVAGSYAVLAVGAASVDFNGMLTLNESGALLWRALEQGADRPRSSPPSPQNTTYPTHRPNRISTNFCPPCKKPGAWRRKSAHTRSCRGGRLCPPAGCSVFSKIHGESVCSFPCGGRGRCLHRPVAQLQICLNVP